MPRRLDILRRGHPTLHGRAQEVADYGAPQLTELIEDMLHTLADSQGVGLAAPQVGAPVRLLIIASRPNPRYPGAPAMSPLVMLNPVVLEASAELESDWEGCLSVPDLRAQVPRHRAIRVAYRTAAGHAEEIHLEGFVARIFQHEFDHLEGLVFLDRLTDPDQAIQEEAYRRLLAET